MSTTAKCNRCGGSGTANTFSEASNLINHAVGMSRGIPCGKNYDRVVEIKTGKKSGSHKKVESKLKEVEIADNVYATIKSSTKKE